MRQADTEIGRLTRGSECLRSSLAGKVGEREGGTDSFKIPQIAINH